MGIVRTDLPEQAEGWLDDHVVIPSLGDDIDASKPATRANLKARPDVTGRPEKGTIVKMDTDSGGGIPTTCSSAQTWPLFGFNSYRLCVPVMSANLFHDMTSKNGELEYAIDRRGKT